MKALFLGHFAATVAPRLLAKLKTPHEAAIVDEDALYAALKEGHLGGAGLDVWWQYPTPAEPERRPSRRPFHELPNVLMTPHCSSSTDASAERRWSVVAANLDCLARGEPLQNVVFQT
jgi:phosphoglycerate dehydrogenase-like enzyme